MYKRQAGIEHAGGLLHYFYLMDEWSILPSLIFMGVGAMTDFGPLIANPISFLLGAAAQLGIYVAYFLAIALGFNGKAAAAISIIGGADGPTSIFLAGKLGQTALMLSLIHIFVMGIPVKLEAFEGPLDLLLHLIEKNKVNIYDIPIVEITDQYMEYIHQLPSEDLDVMSEFLVMAARCV